MKKWIIALAAVIALPAAAWDYPATDYTCSLKFIKNVAEKDGMEKARHLSGKCIAKGFNESKEWSKEHGEKAWDKTKEGSAKAWDKTKEGSAKAWDKTKEGSAKAWDKTKEGTAKAWDKTKDVSEKSWNKTVRKTQEFFE